jgi:hypothetical protein
MDISSVRKVESKCEPGVGFELFVIAVFLKIEVENVVHLEVLGPWFVQSIGSDVQVNLLSFEFGEVMQLVRLLYDGVKQFQLLFDHELNRQTEFNTCSIVANFVENMDYIYFFVVLTA